jgi:hypothetical protein
MHEQVEPKGNNGHGILPEILRNAAQEQVLPKEHQQLRSILMDLAHQCTSKPERD